MNIRLFITDLALVMFVSAAFAQQYFVDDGEMKMPKIIELPAEEDDLYGGTDVIPLAKELSTNESSQENSSDVAVIDDSDMPEELDCNDERLKQQMAHFIYKNISKEQTNSIPEKRRRLLLARNMSDFVEVSEDDADLRKNINTASALAYLKINQRRKVYKVCKSEHNKAADLEDIYAIIYPFAGYYKVVAGNLVSVPEKMDEATFIFSW